MRFTYEYGANGAVGRVKDTKLGREARMAYDLVERPVEAELYENGALTYRLTQEYDQFEQPSVLYERVEEPDNTRSEHTISVTYDKESRPTDVTCESRHMTAVGVPDTTSKRKLAYRYDGLGRIVRRDFHADGDANAETSTPLFQTEYGYEVGGYGANSTTARVQSIVQAGQKRDYWYDKLGNITRECWQGNAAAGGDIAFESDPVTSAEGDTLTLNATALESRYQTTYAYDALGQLLRANDERAGTTWTYAYDLGGNILEKRRCAYTTVADLSALTPEQTVPYAYGDAGWKDKLTSFDGKPITHDAIGNPFTYDGWAYTWKAGRMLHSMVRNGENPVNAEFTYDHTGLRVKKTVNDVDTFYTLNGKKITHIRKGTNNATGADAAQLHFFYDTQGRPMMVRTMDVDYAYLHNLQGDVVGIVDMNGVPVVEYGYDAWGKPVFTEGSMAETLGKDNPFRYRGYVWDEETGLHYLRSRYYDPSWGRFVNADTVLGKSGTLLDHHLFSYCRQNPVMGSDPSGMYDPDERAENLARKQANRRNLPNKASAVPRQNTDLWRYLATEKMQQVSMAFGLVGWKYAGDLLFHSLCGPGNDLHYSSDSELAQTIAIAPQTSKAVEVFRRSGKKYDAIGVRFPDGDLHYAINNATLYLSRDASGRVAGTLYDYYDYSYDPNFGFTAMLFNEAYDLQQSGYLYTYNLYVDLQFN